MGRHHRGHHHHGPCEEHELHGEGREGRDARRHGGPWGGRGGGFGGPGFGPGGGGGRGFGPDGGPRRGRRGMVRVLILRELIDGPQHGYQLMQQIEERTGGTYRPSPGSVYPTLQLLEDQGLVTKAEADGRTVYSLTNDGTTTATEEVERFEQHERLHEEGPPEHMIAIGKAMQAVHAAAFQVVNTGNPEQGAVTAEILAEARRKIYALLAE